MNAVRYTAQEVATAIQIGMGGLSVQRMDVPAIVITTRGGQRFSIEITELEEEV
jgi:hypothetical protein